MRVCRQHFKPTSKWTLSCQVVNCRFIVIAVVSKSTSKPTLCPVNPHTNTPIAGQNGERKPGDAFPFPLLLLARSHSRLSLAFFDMCSYCWDCNCNCVWIWIWLAAQLSLVLVLVLVIVLVLLFGWKKNCCKNILRVSFSKLHYIHMFCIIFVFEFGIFCAFAALLLSVPLHVLISVSSRYYYYY